MENPPSELGWWCTEPKVLSIQSHVVHGCVGNRAATFPMELHGVVVNPLNVVNFSNHTGYKVFKGSRTTVAEYEELVLGLKENGFFDHYYTAVLSGYVGKMDVLTAVGATVQDFLRPKPPEEDGDSGALATPPPSRHRIYVCDPVCGDNGKLYVPAEVVPVYRDVLIPMASIVTPNGFEAAVISQVAECLDTVELAQKAALWFHASPRNVPRVVIKSFEEPAKYPGKILALVSEASLGQEGPPKQYLLQIERIPLGYVSGTGDVFASLLLGHMTTMLRKVSSKSGTPTAEGEQAGVDKSIFVRSVEFAISSTVRILRRTKTDELPPHARRANGEVVKELPLVGSQDLVMDQSACCVEAVELK